MDPVTSFGLASGVMQVVDFSGKALKVCRELYNDGSLAEWRSTAEIADCLALATERLKTSVDQAPGPRSQNDRDIIDISIKCSKTANKLLKELQTLQLDSHGGRYQAITKTLRAIRKKDFVKKVQDELEAYERTLNTCILIRLNAHSIQQAKGFQSLDQSVRDLALQLEDGPKTFAQLVTNEGQALRDHIDRRLGKHAEVNRDLQEQKQFKDSLFFPEIESRQEQIPEAYRGTCRWIFNPSDGSGREVAERNGTLSQDGHRSNAHVQSQPRSNFVDWLRYGTGLYWINGKPGSGKSTLMNYLTSEPETKQALTCWANGSDVVIPSIFFWNLGTVLQKSHLGLLRSLLYQIADKCPNLISIMMDREASLLEIPNESLRSAQMNTWTEKRLLSVLGRLLSHSPRSISLCFFIDGLDEFVGEEDALVKTVRLLINAPQTKVCASSRPEQIFIEEFQGFPKLRLQDFNRVDMQEAAASKLRPNLEQCFQQDQGAIDSLIWKTCEKAQGVFLWLDIMTKDILRGARNKDTMDELFSRLETTPDTIEGLYEHMLNRLDKDYMQEAIKYIRFLATASCWSSSPCTLLDFVLAEDLPWEHVLRDDLTFFDSADFHDLCDRLETRILTRCAGLIEIREHGVRTLWGVYSHKDVDENIDNGVIHDEKEKINVHKIQEKRNVCRHLRKVDFIHRSVLDFLDNRHQTFFQEPNWRPAANLAVARGRLGSMSLIPLMISEEDVGKGKTTTVFDVIECIMFGVFSIGLPEADGEIDPAFEAVAIEMVDHTYRIVSRVDARLNATDLPWHERKIMQRFWKMETRATHILPPFHDCAGFAAYFGCYSYVSRHIFLHKPAREELTYLLACAVVKFSYVVQSMPLMIPSFSVLKLLLRQGADPNSSMCSFLNSCYSEWKIHSMWGTFVRGTFGSIAPYLQQRSREPFIHLRGSYQATQLDSFWSDLIKLFLSCAADVNTSIFWDKVAHSRFYPYITVIMEESPLSYLHRRLAPGTRHYVEGFDSILRSQGGLHRRRCHIIKIKEEGYDLRTWYQVSQDQSDRLLEARPWEGDTDPRDKADAEEAFCRVAYEIKASLTEVGLENPLVNGCDNFWI